MEFETTRVRKILSRRGCPTSRSGDLIGAERSISKGVRRACESSLDNCADVCFAFCRDATSPLRHPLSPGTSPHSRKCHDRKHLKVGIWCWALGVPSSEAYDQLEGPGGKGSERFNPLNCSAESPLIPSADIGHRWYAIERMQCNRSVWRKRGTADENWASEGLVPCCDRTDGELPFPFLGTNSREIFEREGARRGGCVPIRNEGKFVMCQGNTVKYPDTVP